VIGGPLATDVTPTLLSRALRIWKVREHGTGILEDYQVLKDYQPWADARAESAIQLDILLRLGEKAAHSADGVIAQITTDNPSLPPSGL
jgi:hypothetical protein